MAHMELLKKDLDRIMDYIKTKDKDCFICVEGQERVGKSTLALQMAMHADPNFPVDNIIFTKEEFIKKVLNSKKGEVVVVDEGGLLFHSLEGGTKESRIVQQLIQVMGMRNLLVILCSPELRTVNRYVREHRINFLIKVYKHGNYAVFGKQGTKKYCQMATKGLPRKSKKPRYRYIERFGKLKGDLWEQYIAKKEAQVRSFDDFSVKVEKSQIQVRPNVPIKEIATQKHKSTKTIRRWLEAGILEGFKDETGHWMVYCDQNGSHVSQMSKK